MAIRSCTGCLVASLSRLLEPDSTPLTGDGGLEFAESRPYGGAYVLDQIWKRLGIGTTLAGLASPGRGRPRDATAVASRQVFARSVPCLAGGSDALRVLLEAVRAAFTNWLAAGMCGCGWMEAQ